MQREAHMKTSTQRILTTHTGSLPRPPALAALLAKRAHGEEVDLEELGGAVRRATGEIVERQMASHVDVLSDGEMSKPSYATYVVDRLTGFGGRSRFPMPADLASFPSFAERVFEQPGLEALQTLACLGPIDFRGEAAVRRDLEEFRVALEGHAPTEAFLTAASPGVISLFHENHHYATHERYLHAIARAMREEYVAIVEAGFVLQVDCPDLAMGRHIQLAGGDAHTFLQQVEAHVDALDEALEGLPADRLRLHVCWGNYEGPHHLDVGLREIVRVLLRARPAGISFVAANPRHEHEVDVWRDVELPTGKVLIPGVIDPTTNFIEHPELVAQRIERFASIVGRERVIAGTDCGFGTFAGFSPVDPEIVWAKLDALAEGARIASSHLWGRQREDVAAK